MKRAIETAERVRVEKDPLQRQGCVRLEERVAQTLAQRLHSLSYGGNVRLGLGGVRIECLLVLVPLLSGRLNLAAEAPRNLPTS